MRLKSLSKKELQEAIVWAKVDVMVLESEPVYVGQPKEEWRKAYEEKHEKYRKYWDEAFRRGMVDKNSEQLEVNK